MKKQRIKDQTLQKLDLIQMMLEYAGEALIRIIIEKKRQNAMLKDLNIRLTKHESLPHAA